MFLFSVRQYGERSIVFSKHPKISQIPHNYHAVRHLLVMCYHSKHIGAIFDADAAEQGCLVKFQFQGTRCLALFSVFPLRHTSSGIQTVRPD